MANDNSNLLFRVATQDDASNLQQLVESSFQAHDSRQDWTGNTELASQFRISVEEILASIDKPNTVTLIAFDPLVAGGGESNYGSSDILVASVTVSNCKGDTGRLSMIAVNQHYQRGGVGRQVLEFAEDYCRKTWGTTKFSLNALSTRKALIEWYVRRGYQCTGGTSPFPRERFHQLLLPDDMCFIEMEKALTSELVSNN